MSCSRRRPHFFLLAILPLLVWQPAGAQTPEARKPSASPDLGPLTSAKKDAIPAVLCSNGELLQFARDRIDSIVEDRLTLKPGTFVMRLIEVPTPTEVLERRALIKIGRAFGYPHKGDFTLGGLKGWSGTIKESVTCQVADVWAPVAEAEAFDKPVVLNQFNMAGRVEGSATYESVKAKDKPNADACVVVTVDAPSWPEPVPADLRGIFMQELMAPSKKGPTPVASRDAVPAGARANELRVMLYGTGSEERKTLVANAIFAVSDAKGRVLTRGHAFRAVGKKREQDVRELARYLTCS